MRRRRRLRASARRSHAPRRRTSRTASACSRRRSVGDVGRSTRSPAESTTSATATAAARREAGAARRGASRRRRPAPRHAPDDDPVLVALADAAYAATPCRWTRSTSSSTAASMTPSASTYADLRRPGRLLPPASPARSGGCRLAVFGRRTAERREPRSSPTPSAWPCSSPTSCATSSRTGQMGRVYLPGDDVARFGADPDLTGPRRRRSRPGRASKPPGPGSGSTEGLQLLPLLDRRSRACVAAMAGIYRRLLDRIAADPAPSSRAACRCRRGRSCGSRPQPRRARSVGSRRRPGSTHEPDPGRGGRRRAGRPDRRARLADAGAAVRLLERRPRLGGATWSFRARRRLVRQRPARVPALLHGVPGLPRPHRRGPTAWSSRTASTIPVARARRASGRALRRATPCPRRCTSRAALPGYRHLTGPRAVVGRAGGAGAARASTPTTRRSTSDVRRLAGRARPVARAPSTTLWDLIARPTLNLPAARRRWPSPRRCSAPGCSTDAAPPTSAGPACRSAALHADRGTARPRAAGCDDLHRAPRRGHRRRRRRCGLRRRPRRRVRRRRRRGARRPPRRGRRAAAERRGAGLGPPSPSSAHRRSSTSTSSSTGG